MHPTPQRPAELSHAGPPAPWAQEPGALVAHRPPAPPGASLSFPALLKALRTRWLLATVAGLLLAAPAATAVWLALPPKYQAVALLRVLPAEPKVLGAEERASQDKASSYQKTQLALIRSRHVLEAAAKSDRVRTLPSVQRQPDPAGWLEKQLRAGFIDDSDLLRLAVSSPS